MSLLTIAGYSVNDTVVIFDRIRENLKSKKEGYNETNNEVTQLVSNLLPSFGPINLESLLS